MIAPLQFPSPRWVSAALLKRWAKKKRMRTVLCLAGLLFGFEAVGEKPPVGASS